MKQCRMQNQKWPNVAVENLTNTAFLYSIHTVAKVTPKEVLKVGPTTKKIVFSLTCVVYLMLHFLSYVTFGERYVLRLIY
jgi:hypothetical protein